MILTIVFCIVGFFVYLLVGALMLYGMQHFESKYSIAGFFLQLYTLGCFSSYTSWGVI